MRNPPHYWQARLRQAANEEAVLSVVREFVAALPRDDVAKLPPASRPDGLASRDAVIELNVQVARDELLYPGPPEARELLREMSIVLTEASTRLANLSLGPPSGV
jgi:hypothetical protein